MPEKSILEELQASFPKKGKSDWSLISSTEINESNPLEKLSWQAQQGIHFLPYYDKSDTQPLDYQHNFNFQPRDSFLGQRSWNNLPNISVNEEKASNLLSLNHLMNGGDGILFDLQKKNIKLSELLNGIEWPFCNISFVSGPGISILQEISDHCHTKSYNAAEIEGSIFWKSTAELPVTLIRGFTEFKKFRPLGFYIVKSTPIEEIVEALTQSVKTLEKLVQEGISKEIAIRSVAFSVAVENNFMLGISKLKALRMLWFQIARAYGCTDFKPDDLHIHARSEAWINNDYQPHGNMVKATTTSIAAICGGCNSITVFGEDETNSLMQRMARNTSILLREESYLNKVADPVAGSYAIEVMMNALAKDSWSRFQSAMSA